MAKTNIVLTGMPGSGKSTIGVILAKELGMKFIDTDIHIQTEEKMGLQEIMDKYGMDEFLRIEKEHILKLDVSGTVIAPGGSVVLNEQTMHALKKNALVVFINTPLDKIHARIDIGTRGIAMKPGETLENVWDTRKPLYYSTADLIVDEDGRDQLQIALLIAGLYRTLTKS